MSTWSCPAEKKNNNRQNLTVPKMTLTFANQRTHITKGMKTLLGSRLFHLSYNIKDPEGKFFFLMLVFCLLLHTELTKFCAAMSIHSFSLFYRKLTLNLSIYNDPVCYYSNREWASTLDHTFCPPVGPRSLLLILISGNASTTITCSAHSLTT